MSEPTPREGGITGPSRRDVLVKGGIAAGAAWVIPVVASDVALAAGTPPPPVDPCTICGSNAVVNGNANSGVSGWTTLGAVTTPAYTPGFPAPNPSAPNLYFNLTNTAPLTATRISQFVNLPAACIGRSIQLTGYARAQLGLFDASMTFFNGNSQGATISTGVAARPNMTPFSIGGTIPATATRVRVQINFQRPTVGGPIGQADLISLIVGCI